MECSEIVKALFTKRELERRCDEWIQKTEAQIQAKAEEEKGFCLGTVFLAILFMMRLVSARLAREQQFMNF
jgi:hypothetical protein